MKNKNSPAFCFKHMFSAIGAQDLIMYVPNEVCVLRCADFLSLLLPPLPLTHPFRQLFWSFGHIVTKTSLPLK